MTRLLQSFVLLFVASLFISCGSNPDKELNYKGVCFKYPSYWDVETETSESGNIYIDASEKFASDAIFLITIIPEEMEPLEMINNYLEKMSENFDLEKQPVEYGRFGQYESSFVTYKASKLRDKAYGIVYSFNKDNKTVLIIKQSNRDYDLKHEKYKLMENSLSINQPEDTIR